MTTTASAKLLATRAQSTLKRILREAESLGLLAPAPGAPRPFASVSIVSARKITELNAKFRRKDRETDVLSFPPPEAVRAATGFLGELVICSSVLRRQAKDVGNTPEQELLVLLVHGTLHLLGLDHERSTRENREMARLEAKLLQALASSASGLIARAV